MQLCSPDSHAGRHRTTNRGEDERALIPWWIMIKGPMRRQHTVWRLHKSDSAAVFPPSAAACFKDYAKEDGSAWLSSSNLLLHPFGSPACRDFPSAQEAFAWFPLLTTLQRNPSKTPQISELIHLNEQHVRVTIRTGILEPVPSGSTFGNLTAWF